MGFAPAGLVGGPSAVVAGRTVVTSAVGVVAVTTGAGGLVPDAVFTRV